MKDVWKTDRKRCPKLHENDVTELGLVQESWNVGMHAKCA